MEARIWLIAIGAVVLIGCGVDQSAESVTTETTIEDTAAVATSTSVSTSTSISTATSTVTESPSTSTTAETEAGSRRVEVVMTEFAFDPDAIQVTAGETVTFVVTNVGIVEHELRLSNAHRIEEHIESGHADHHEDDQGHHMEGGDVTLTVAAGDTGEIEVTFPNDTTIYTEIVCLIPGHYEAGMKGKLTYES